MDVGIDDCLLTVMHPDGTVTAKVPSPRALHRQLAELQRASRALSRKTEGSTRWRKAKRKLADRFYPSSKTCSACALINTGLTLRDRTWACPGCGVTHDRDENAGTNLARLPASQAEAQSGSKTASVRRVAVKRVNHLGKVAA